MSRIVLQRGFNIAQGNVTNVSVDPWATVQLDANRVSHLRGYVSGGPANDVATATVTISYGPVSVTLPQLLLDPNKDAQPVLPFDIALEPLAVTSEQAILLSATVSGTDGSFNVVLSLD